MSAFLAMPALLQAAVDPQAAPNFWPWFLATALKLLVFFTLYMVIVAYSTLAERKISAWIQGRHGPNRVGPRGYFQPLADGVKNFMKEETLPPHVNKALFIIAPMLSFVPALMVWAIIPWGAAYASPWGRIDMVLADLPIGFLFTLGIGSLGVYGIVLAGWGSNNKYALLGGLRSSAQMISYEISMGLALITVLMVSSSLNLSDIVMAQDKGRGAGMGLGFLSWNWLPLLPMFAVYLISGVAETNRAPFDVVEGESEIVAGHMVEYSGMAFAMFFLAEYANMILISAMTSIFFLGGWLSPVGFIPDGFHWMAAKMAAVLFFFLWIRATFPRYRYDQLMRLGWKVFVPLTLVWILVIGVWMMSPLSIWK